jgi:hypothetical protein
VTASDVVCLVAAGFVWLLILLAVRAEQAQAAQDDQKSDPTCLCGCGLPLTLDDRAKERC